MNDRNATNPSQQQMQLVWLIKELIILKVSGIDRHKFSKVLNALDLRTVDVLGHSLLRIYVRVCVALLRQIQGGNVKSASNRWLCTAMCTLFIGALCIYYLT
jgi:hypothetical protein